LGDIGHLDEAGYLTITDRVLTWSSGVVSNIAPREVEEVLFDHPAVVDCAVFGSRRARWRATSRRCVELRPR